MSFIKAQKIVRDAQGVIQSGSASLVDAVYDTGRSVGHSRHAVREKLGKVLYLSADRRSGVFLSPTRGLVEYNSASDTFASVEAGDPRIPRWVLPPSMEIHTVFGDTYLLLLFLEKCGLLGVLRCVFQKKEELERVLAHILHGVIRDGSRITCDTFLGKSFASYLLSDLPYASLKSDTRFFASLGADAVKVAFFKSFVAEMRKRNPRFGKGCYVDSTPLPNDIGDNPFNALCCHGVGSSEVMTRLVLVLDEASGLPVWYDIIPGNVLDINTVMTTVNDVAATLDIEIDSLVLDAGYVSKELLDVFHIGSEKTIIGRMPARKGFPYKSLYWDVKDLVGKGKYAFVRKGHAYFGYRKEVVVFGRREYAYVYVDKYNALKRVSDYLTEHEEEFEALKMKDKDWTMVKYGYFVLLSNIDASPRELLGQYFGRTDIEVVFKTGKEYLDLLPLAKWTDLTVRGKILHDIIDTITLLLLRKEFASSGVSTTELFGRAQALMCFKDREGNVTVETPAKQLKEYYGRLKMEVPARVRLAQFAERILG